MAGTRKQRSHIAAEPSPGLGAVRASRSVLGVVVLGLGFLFVAPDMVWAAAGGVAAPGAEAGATAAAAATGGRAEVAGRTSETEQTSAQSPAATVASSAPVSMAEAARTAAASGTRVEATSKRTESAQTFVNPDGTATLELSAVPVRVRQGDSWVPVDMTLVVRADGSVGPRASALPMSFSRGGSAPLVRLGRGEARLSMAWPAPLGQPSLVGNTATYPEVLPGVDLVMTAGADSVSEVLVVKTAQAAQQAALKSLRFGVTAEGGTVRASAGGGFAVVDRNGAAIVTSPKPQMWDSASPADSSQDRVRGPRDGDRVAVMAEQVTTTSVTVQPVPSMLTSAATRFPLYLDPAITAGQHSRAMIDKSFPAMPYYNWRVDEGVGYQNFTGVDTKRLFVSYNTGGLAYKDIRAATLSAYETSASSCSLRGLEAWRTGAFGSATNWTNGTAAGMWISRLTTVNTAAGRTACLPNGASYDFNVTGAVAAVAAAGGATTYLGLKAASETDNLAWRRIRQDLTLSIWYNNPPTAPTPLSTTSPATGCVSGAGRPVINDYTPVLTARLNDVDPQNVYGQFAVSHLGDAAPYGYWYSLTAAPNQLFSPSSVLNFGATAASYAWKVRTYDGYVWGPWSATCEFTIDTTVPAPPSVTPKGMVVAAGASVTFTVSAAPDVTKLMWAHNSDAPQTAVNMATSPYTFVVNPTNSGPHRVRVWAYDAAGNQTLPDIADFTVADRPRDGRWRLDENTGSATADVAAINTTHPVAHPMALAGTASWRTDGRWYDPGFVPTDHALSFTAAGGGGTAATSVGNVVRTNESFTVMAALRPAVSTVKQVALSEDGTSNSGVTLGAKSVALDAASNTLSVVWAVSVPHPVSGAELSATCPQVGLEPTAWTHIAGRYNGRDHQLELFIDGGLCATLNITESVTPANAGGPLRLGRAQSGAAASSPWTGDVDEVQVWNGFVGDGDIAYEATALH